MVALNAYVAGSAYIFEKGFGLSEQWYSFYFALNALGSIAAPFLYLRLSRSFSRISTITFCFVVMIASGALVCFFGNIGPLVFALALLPASVMGELRAHARYISHVRPAERGHWFRSCADQLLRYYIWHGQE